MHDSILIVDFGSQVTKLIARRVREEHVYCELVPFQSAEAALRTLRPKGIILSGGPASVLDKDAPRAPPEIFAASVPVLGICYEAHAPWRGAAAKFRSQYRRLCAGLDHARLQGRSD
jgi:GMP synthase (glutamine-hydrolysing)